MASDLLRGLARPEDRLREAAAQRPVVVDLGEAQVLVGEGLQALGRLLGRDGARAHGVEQVAEGREDPLTGGSQGRYT